MFVEGKSKTIFFPSNTLIYGISRDGSKNFNTHLWAHDPRWAHYGSMSSEKCTPDSTLAPSPPLVPPLWSFQPPLRPFPGGDFQSSKSPTMDFFTPNIVADSSFSSFIVRHPLHPTFSLPLHHNLAWYNFIKELNHVSIEVLISFLTFQVCELFQETLKNLHVAKDFDDQPRKNW